MSLLQSNSKLVAKLELNPKHRSNVCFSKCGKYEMSMSFLHHVVFFYWNAYHFALLLHCKGFQSIASSNKAKGFTF